MPAKPFPFPECFHCHKMVSYICSNLFTHSNLRAASVAFCVFFEICESVPCTRHIVLWAGKIMIFIVTLLAFMAMTYISNLHQNKSLVTKHPQISTLPNSSCISACNLNNPFVSCNIYIYIYI